MDKILTLALVCSIHDTQIGNATKRRICISIQIIIIYKLHRLMYDWVKMYSSSNVVCFPGRECNPRSVVVESGSLLLLRQWLGRSPCQPEQQQNRIGQQQNRVASSEARRGLQSSSKWPRKKMSRWPFASGLSINAKKIEKPK